MGYIKSVVPLEGHRLFLDMEGGSNVIVDLSVKLHTMKYGDLADEALFKTADTDGNMVVWGGGRIRITAQELIDIALYGDAIP